MKIDHAGASTASRSPDSLIHALKAARTRRGAEHALSVDTTAAGGNTTLMSMRDEVVERGAQMADGRGKARPSNSVS